MAVLCHEIIFFREQVKISAVEELVSRDHMNWNAML